MKTRNFIQNSLFTGLWLILAARPAWSQLPVVALPNPTVPTLSIYISPTGNNANPGTMASPVATFQQAMQLIPFSSTADVHGEIVFLPGDYYPTQNLIQGVADYAQGGHFKHISVRGVDSVNIFGDNIPTAQVHLMWLRGSGIRVENLHLFHARRGSAIVIGNPDANFLFNNSSQMHDVVIKDITMDSTQSSSLISYFVDRLLYENVEAVNGQNENTGPNANCQWGSAIRAEFSTNVTIRNCRAFHNRGEGINVAGSSNALVEGCVSYDNFAPNFYCIRSNNVIFRKNLAYNRDSLFWRDCNSDAGGSPVARQPSAGLSISQEMNYNDITVSACSPSASVFKDLVTITHNVADSIFIYNNIFILAPFYLIDESEGNCFFPGAAKNNNFSNIYVENNTFVADVAPAHAYRNQSPVISMNLNPTNFHGCFPNIDGRGVYRFENLVWKNNIITLADSLNAQAISPALILYGGRPCNGGLLPDKFNSSNNLWHHSLPQVYDVYANANIPNFLQGSTDVINGQMGTFCDPDSLQNIYPVSSPADFRYPFYRIAPSSAYIQDDFFGNTRTADNNNVGAIVAVATVDIEAKPFLQGLTLFPNPTQGHFSLRWNQGNEECTISMYDLMGRSVPFYQQREGDQIQIEMNTAATGIFFVKVETPSISGICKLIRTN